MFPQILRKEAESATGGVLNKKVLLKILQNSQENTRARVSFLIKLAQHWHKCFSVNFEKFLRMAFCTEHLWWLLLNPIQDGSYWGCLQMRESKKALFLEICHTYPTVMKFATVIPYLKKILKTCRSRDTPLEFCWHQHFSPEISNFCWIKKFWCRLHFDT